MKFFLKLLSLVVLSLALFSVYFDPSLKRTSLKSIYYINQAFNWLQSEYSKDNWSLTGNFAPVKEEVFLTNLKVSYGKIPLDLQGAFLRNGPNTPYPGLEGPYHVFDGQGMVHSLRIMGGSANYSNKYMETDRYKHETDAGFSYYVRVGGLKGYVGIARVILSPILEMLGFASPSPYAGTANTALVYHHGKVLALVESSLPFGLTVLENGDLVSENWDYTFREWNFPFTAHPKVDPVTNELAFFGYSLRKKPYCVYGLTDSNGKLLTKLEVDIELPVMMHDFSITENYAIIMDLPLVFDGVIMVKNSTSPFFFDKTRPSRFGIFPKNTKSESDIRWFTAKPCFVFHVLNSWEEGDEVVLIASRFNEFDLELKANSIRQSIYEWRFNLKDGTTSERVLFDIAADFPRAHPQLIGRKNRYGYFVTLLQTETFKLDGIVKVDLLKNEQKFFKYGEGIFGGEAIFVPRKDIKESESEDDGYLLTYVHDENVDKSSVWIIDAQSLETVAKVDLPNRVPYGFHAHYLTESELKLQNKIK